MHELIIITQWLNAICCCQILNRTAATHESIIIISLWTLSKYWKTPVDVAEQRALFWFDLESNFGNVVIWRTRGAKYMQRTGMQWQCKCVIGHILQYQNTISLFLFTGLGREYALAFAERGASVVGKYGIFVLCPDNGIIIVVIVTPGTNMLFVKCFQKCEFELFSILCPMGTKINKTLSIFSMHSAICTSLSALYVKCNALSILNNHNLQNN